jgi:molybdopterin-binding protein
MSASASTPLLRAEGLRVSYTDRFTLDIERLDVPEGGTLAILGPSGSGKSTLLRVLGLLEEPDSGRVLLAGKRVDTRSREGRLEMAAVFQDPYLFHGTVADNVALGLRLRGVPRSERPDRVAASLERVGLSDMGDASALQLSGGEAQRVALARALVLEPKVLLLDEPLTSLDTPLKRDMMVEFSRILHHAGTTAVYVTHDQEEAAVVADRAAVLRDGRIIAEGPVEDVIGLPRDDWLAGFVGMAPPLRGTVVAAEEGALRVDCDGVEVVAVGTLAKGTPVRLGIRPEDVALVGEGEDLPPTSIRNLVHTKVVEVSPRGATYVVTVGHGSFGLAASVSRAAVRELAIVPEMPVIAAFKATAVRVTADEGAEAVV